MTQNRETREVQAPALLAVGARPDVLAWRQTVGTFRAYDNPRRVVKIGKAGMADAMMIVAVEITPAMVGQVVGVAVAAEFKVEGQPQKPAQKRWQRAVEARGGIYAVVRSAADMLDVVRRVQAGLYNRKVDARRSDRKTSSKLKY